VPEVKLRRQQVQITGRPSMMHGGASPRIALQTKKKGAADKEVAVDPNDTEKKLRLSMELNVK
jgi:hypothetical protein